MWNRLSRLEILSFFSFKDSEGALLAYYYLNRFNPGLSISAVSRDDISNVNQSLNQLQSNPTLINQILNTLYNAPPNLFTETPPEKSQSDRKRGSPLSSQSNPPKKSKLGKI